MSVPIWKPRLADWFAAHHGVVTHAQFLAMGASPATVADLCRRGEITRIAAGVYCSAHYPVGDEQRMVATCSHTTTSMIGFTTACRLWNLRGMPKTGLHALVPHGSTPTVDGVIVHRCRRIDPVDVVERADGIRLTSPPRSLFDAADMVGPRVCTSALEQVLDQYCTFGTITDTLIRLGHPRRPGTRTMTRVIRNRPSWRAALQSDLEVVVLAEIERQQLPAPVTQYPLTLPTGAPAILDFAWPEVKVALEVDHPVWHAGADPSHRDKHRDRKAATIGWQTVRVTDLDVSGSLAAAIADVAEILVVRSHAGAACGAHPRTACGPLPRLHGRADFVNP